MKLLLFENLRPLQQESQQRNSRSLSLEKEEEEEPSVLLELPSFAGDGADEVVEETTASASRSSFRLSRVIVRLSWSSRAELCDNVSLW